MYAYCANTAAGERQTAGRKSFFIRESPLSDLVPDINGLRSRTTFTRKALFGGFLGRRRVDAHGGRPN
jgi:hypothetical protein